MACLDLCTVRACVRVCFLAFCTMLACLHVGLHVGAVR